MSLKWMGPANLVTQNVWNVMGLLTVNAILVPKTWRRALVTTISMINAWTNAQMAIMQIMSDKLAWSAQQIVLHAQALLIAHLAFTVRINSTMVNAHTLLALTLSIEPSVPLYLATFATHPVRLVKDSVNLTVFHALLKAYFLNNSVFLAANKLEWLIIRTEVDPALRYVETVSTMARFNAMTEILKMEMAAHQSVQ